MDQTSRASSVLSISRRGSVRTFGFRRVSPSFHSRPKVFSAKKTLESIFERHLHSIGIFAAPDALAFSVAYDGQHFDLQISKGEVRGRFCHAEQLATNADRQLMTKSCRYCICDGWGRSADSVICSFVCRELISADFSFAAICAIFHFENFTG
jgi:hypothetical protein